MTRASRRTAGLAADRRYLHATRAELLRRLGRDEEARDAYSALELVHDDTERRHLERRLRTLGG